MLPKPHRLTKEKDFEKVYKKGKFFAQNFLMCRILKNSFKISRFGIVIGTKVSKKATKRNKVKRRLREAIRLKLNKIKKGFDILIMVKPEIVDKDYHEIDKVLISLLKKARLL